MKKTLIQKLKDYMTPFQWCEVTAIIAFTLYFALTNTEQSFWYILIDSLAAICGVFCVVLCAGGKKSQYYWGFVNIVAYIVIAFINKLYGEVMLNALYYLPTQFIGMYVWSKHYHDKEDQVEGKRMKPLFILIWALISVGGVFGYKLILDALGGNTTLLDSMSTVVSLLANALMVARFREQWLLWIVVDVVTVIMWLLAGDLIMTVMWSIYLLNAIYGWIMWCKMSKSSQPAQIYY